MLVPYKGIVISRLPITNLHMPYVPRADAVCTALKAAVMKASAQFTFQYCSVGCGLLLHHPAWDYLAHRIKNAGGNIESLFDHQAVVLLSKHASTPSALGNLANPALIKAHRLGERKALAPFIDSGDGEPSVRAVRRRAGRIG